MCWPAAMDPAVTLLLTVGAAVVLGVRGHNAPRIIPPCVPGQTVVQAARTTAALGGWGVGVGGRLGLSRKMPEVGRQP